MKILQLRFKNLNSLAGEWSINFTAAAFMADGIFAITGPTGAGKSTIMDAICLALYGRTPRLKAVNASSNEIMSRHTGECFSEVVFETQKGQFRCTWSQHRARKQASGELQNPRHEIADNLSGKVIESGLRAVAEAIITVTGMDFERFTQSMLLAQGGFAAFLQANPDERAPILEEITGTAIYTEISKWVFERKRTENNQLDLLKAQTDGIVLLKAEEEAAIKEQLQEKIAAEATHSLQKAAVEEAILWLKGVDSLKQEISDVEAESRAHALALGDFEAQREILQKALQAARLDGAHATITGQRKLQMDEAVKLAASSEKLPELQALLQTAKQENAEAQEALKAVQQNAINEREIITRIREVDVAIQEKRRVLAGYQKEHRLILQNKIEKIREKKALQQQIQQEQTKIGQIAQYLTDHAADAALVTEMTGIREKLDQLQLAKASHHGLEIQLAAAQQALMQIEKKLQAQEGICDDIQKKQAEAQQNVAMAQQALAAKLAGRELREYRAEQSGLLREMAYLNKIASLEAERKLLADEQPCPLCGALHHPYAEGNIPEADTVEQQIAFITSLIGEAEKLEAALKSREASLQKVENDLTEATTALRLVQNSKDNAKEAEAQKSAEKVAALNQYTTQLKSVSDQLEAFGLQLEQETEPETLANQLNDRLKKWNDHRALQLEMQQNIDNCHTTIKQTKSLIEAAGMSLKSKLAEIVAYQQALHTLSLDRNEIFGQRNPDAEEKRIANQLAAAEKAERESSDKNNNLSQQLLDLDNRIGELNASIAAREAELALAEASFETALHELGFENEAAFVSCQLPADQKERLSRTAKSLDEKQADIQMRLKDRQERLTREEEKHLTAEPLDSLIAQQADCLAGLNAIRMDIGAKKQQLNANEAAKAQLGQVMQQIAAQKTECQRWDMLSTLIGSSDGKKYRNFAQGLTFEIMVKHANHQLMKLTDRYLLIRDQQQPLDLNVVDHYQAGEVRSTKNLSGGESFIVSLALALGLSKMASKKVRVDSLFLDEGFGTLDEDTLETALETLASLRQDGKLIGIISHVPALKERIATKILVQKHSGGKSRISGPGCTAI